MAPDLIRDSAFGQIVRLVSRNRIFLYAEERDPSTASKYVNKEKSANFARYGQATVPKDQNEKGAASPARKRKSRTNSDDTLAANEGAILSEEEKEKERERERNGSTPEGLFNAAPNGEETEVNAASGARLDPEQGKDKTIVDWYGPEDQENPRNWSRGKRFFVTFQIVFLTFSVYIGSAIYSAGIMSVTKQFGVSQVAATLGLTLYVAGYGLGPLVWAPMSEIPAIGRNPIYIATLLVFVIFQVPTALAPNFGCLLAFRFLTGLFGSPALATGGASIGDMYRPQKQAYGLAIWGIGAVSGPVLGPLVSGFAIEAKDWSWSIWELMWLSGFCWVFLFFLLPETSSTNILVRRTKRLRKITGDDKLTCEPELMAEGMTGKDIVTMTLIRPITLNFTEPMVFLLNLYIALIYGLLYIWFESFPLVFISIYNFSLGTEGVAFLGLLVGALVAMVGLFIWMHVHQEKQFSADGTIVPEKRLVPAMVGSFFVPICLFWFGWSARPDIHWIMPIIGSSFFSVAAFLLFQAVLPYLADAYPDYTASVFAGNDLFRSSFGAGFPLFAGAMYHKLGVAWASSLLAFLGVAFIPIPFVLYKYGERLRRMSKHAKKDF